MILDKTDTCAKVDKQTLSVLFLSGDEKGPEGLRIRPERRQASIPTNSTNPFFNPIRTRVVDGARCLSAPVASPRLGQPSS